MIDIANLHYRLLAIDSLSLSTGVTSVIGPNGSGKTTFLKLCTGIVVPESGSILIEGTAPRAMDIGWVNEFPDRNFIIGSVVDEVASALRFRHLPPGEITLRTSECLERFGLTRLSDRAVGDLSGGEKVIVAVAAALVQHPAILILDECDSHLDSRCMETIYQLIRDSHIPYVIRSTQDLEAAAESDCVVFLEDGRVRHSGKPEQVFTEHCDTPFYPLSWRLR